MEFKSKQCKFMRLDQVGTGEVFKISDCGAVGMRIFELDKPGKVAYVKLNNPNAGSVWKKPDDTRVIVIKVIMVGEE